ncbi:hypothetical protein MBLNU230_g3705t1 [Neophaeotheca triangularis]
MGKAGLKTPADYELSIFDEYGLDVPGPLQEVMKIIKDVEKLPSCNKMASQALLNSCSALETPQSNDGEQRGPDTMLDEAKSIYAARLAVCELSGARATVPPGCTSFLPTANTARKTGFRGFIGRNGLSAPTTTYDHYEDVTEQNLDQCLGALESKPQWWTSYSNSRQNAVVMCHAMRSEVEKDEQLHLYKVLAGLTNDITGSLSGSKQEFQAVRDAFGDLSSNMRQFHLDLYQEQQDKQAEIARFWAVMVDKVQQTFDGLTKGADVVQDKLAEAARQADSNHNQLQDTFSSVSQQVSEVAVKQRREAAELSSDMVGLSELTSYLRTIMQEEITKSLLSVANGLEAANSMGLAVQNQLQQHSDGIVIAAREIAALADRVVDIDQRMDEMHRDTGAKHLLLQAQANRTMETLELANAHVETWTASMASVLSFLDGNWVESAIYATGLMVAFTIATLFSFAFWSGKMGLPICSALSASLATGFALTLISTAHQDSIRPAYNAISTMSPQASLIFSFVGVAMTVGLFLAVKFFFGRKQHTSLQSIDQEKEYLPSFTASVDTKPRAVRLPVNDPKYFARQMSRRSQM